jgi:alpha-mannosidase
VARQVAVVPHTHWDREWYASFQTFRLRLVDALDAFLPAFEADPSCARFLLDGQMALVDDYLAVRPEAEARLRRLAAGGRVAMGPWYVLPDEFLVSGETLIRNLQKGLDRAAGFGGAMTIGYLPDMFGHVAQMPQLLALSGFEHAVVWRGVPSGVDRTAFRWAAPDGSVVRAEYLRHGYGNGAAVPDDAKALVRRVADHERELRAALRPDDPILWMNGTDHQLPPAWLGRVVAEANAIQDDYELVIRSLAEYLAAAPTDGLTTITGELRSGARAHLLMGVLSNRVDIKQAAARVERNLERRAEPLCALFLPEHAWPGALLDLAWTEVIRNSAHDSICGCSIDEVSAAVLHRYREAGDIATGLAGRALDAVAESMAAPGPVVVNPSARPRSGVVELRVSGDATVGDAQVLDERSAAEDVRTLAAADLGAVLGAIRGQTLGDAFVNAIGIEDSGDALDVTIHADVRLRPGTAVEEAKRELYARAGARPDLPVRVAVHQPASRRILVRIDGVPGFGWKQWAPGPLRVEPVRADGRTMTNGVMTVAVDPDDGTFSINGHAGLDRLVDGGDAGDTYNYSPPPDDVVVETPTSVTVEAVERGPIRAVLRVTRLLAAPVTTHLMLLAGEDLVRVHTSFVNTRGDHRLRSVFPLPRPATSSLAECAFATVERGLDAEGSATERGLPTFPSRRFVRAGGLTVVHEGLHEYELVDDGGALALTLLRATGVLSGEQLDYRTVPAGPPIAVEGPQLLGPVEARYAIHVGDRDPYALVDDAFLPLEVIDSDGGGDRPDRGSALAISGAEVSALRRVDGGIELRVFNPSDEPTTVRLDGRRGWLVDLRGTAIAPFEGYFPLGPWTIATARFAAS